MRTCRWLLLILVVGAPSEALAQSPPEWTAGIKLGKPLFVTLANGVEVDGAARNVSPDGLVIATAVGERIVAFRDIRQVQRKDSAWNGVLLGAGAGLALGILAGPNDPCDNGFLSDLCVIEKRMLAGGGVIAGGFIGWGIDAMIEGRSTLFEGSVAPRVLLAATPKGMSARLIVSW